MTVIYQNFAKEFQTLNQTIIGDRTTLLSGQRAYAVGGKPYFDNVHFPKVSESWFTHERL